MPSMPLAYIIIWSHIVLGSLLRKRSLEHFGFVTTPFARNLLQILSYILHQPSLIALDPKQLVFFPHKTRRRKPYSRQTTNPRLRPPAVIGRPGCTNVTTAGPGFRRQSPSLDLNAMTTQVITSCALCPPRPCSPESNGVSDVRVGCVAWGW